MLVSSPDNAQSVINDADHLSVVDIDLEDSTDDAASVGVYAKEIFYNLRESEVCVHNWTYEGAYMSSSTSATLYCILYYTVTLAYS